MRKSFLSLLALILTTGLAFANPVVLLSFDGKQMTVKDGEKESTYKVTDKTTYAVSTGDGDKDIPKDIAVKALTDEKAKGKKIEITVAGDTVSQVKLPGRKPKP